MNDFDVGYLVGVEVSALRIKRIPFIGGRLADWIRELIMLRQVKQDGEHLFRDLARAIEESGYMSKDDSVATTGDVIQSAIYVIDRMKDDFHGIQAYVNGNPAKKHIVMMLEGLHEKF